jgi:putative membrane protein
MFQRNPGPGPGPYVELHHGGDHPWFGLLLLLLLLGAVALAALTFWRSYRHPPAASAATSAPSSPPPDPALAELRLRYARGDIDRDDYLQRATDLGDVVPASPPQPQTAGDG